MSQTGIHHPVLREILEKTGELASAAQEQDWMLALLLEQERRDALERFFESDAPTQHPEETAAVMNALLDVDRTLIKTAEQARSQCADDMGVASRTRRAHSAYHTVAAN
jgi:hypothetical protein